jgi:phage regulator Rha-like protein
MEDRSKELVTLDEEEPKTTSYIVAEQLGIAHRNMVELIKDHQGRIEKHFGLIRFETGKINGRGRPEQFANLTENQTHYVLTLSRNTDKAMEVKALFVKAFAQAKQLLAQSDQGQIAALQQEIARLQAKEQLLLPERVTDKQAVEVLDQLQTMVHEEQLAPAMDKGKRYDLEFALRKAQGYFKGLRIQTFNLRDKPNQWGEVRIKEYPDETEKDREYRLNQKRRLVQEGMKTSRNQ